MVVRDRVGKGWIGPRSTHGDGVGAAGVRADTGVASITTDQLLWVGSTAA